MRSVQHDSLMVSMMAAFVLLTCAILAVRATQPFRDTYRASSIFKRAVIWGKTDFDGAKSAVHTDDQKAALTKTMGEITKLATADSKGLDLIIDAMTIDKPNRNPVSTKDQSRLRNTYRVLFSRVSKEDLPGFTGERTFIKSLLCTRLCCLKSLG